MANTLIYIYGQGVQFQINELQKILEDRFCLNNITEEGDSKLIYEGEEVSELVFSKNLDYIKIDADHGMFESLVYEFSIFLKDVNPKHKFAFGLSGDPSDYHELPLFENKNECSSFLRKDFDENNLPS